MTTAAQKAGQFADVSSEALKKVTPEMIKEAMGKAVKVVDKLQKYTPGSFDTISGAITGGDVAHKLKENGLSDGEARAGGALAIAMSAFGPTVVANAAKNAGVLPIIIARGIAQTLRSKTVSTFSGPLIAELADWASRQTDHSSGLENQEEKKHHPFMIDDW